MITSKWIGILGTILAGVAAGLADFHGVATSPEVQIALTGILGWLTGHHIISGAFAKNVESDVTHGASIINKLNESLGVSLEHAAQALQKAAPTYKPPT